MEKGEEFETGWTDVTMPIIGDEWQFIYKPQTDIQAELPENELPVPLSAKPKKVKPKNKELIIGINELEKPAKNPIN